MTIYKTTTETTKSILFLDELKKLSSYTYFILFLTANGFKLKEVNVDSDCEIITIHSFKGKDKTMKGWTAKFRIFPSATRSKQASENQYTYNEITQFINDGFVSIVEENIRGFYFELFDRTGNSLCVFGNVLDSNKRGSGISTP